MKIKQLKENQTYNLYLSADSVKWDNKEGEIEDRLCLFSETATTKDINKFLNYYGLEFKDFEDWRSHGLEKNRFTYNKIIEEQGQEYLEYYELYIEIATLSKEVFEDE